MRACSTGGAADRSPTSPSLRPFRAALARLVPGWAEPGAPAAAPDAALTLAEGLLELFHTAYDGPVVLALEDLHAADPETLELLDRLSAGLLDRPVLVVGTWRTGEPTAGPAVPRSWPGLRRLDLVRLDDDAAAGLALDCAGAPLPDDVVAAVLGARSRAAPAGRGAARRAGRARRAAADGRRAGSGPASWCSRCRPG